jgi:hypothetical protein
MKRFLSLLLVGVALFGLSGCVRYDLGIHYFSQTRGEIVQRVQLGESVTRFNGAIARQWLTRLEQRTRQVGGQTQQRSPDEITLRIPFYNGADLAEKFNQFFQPMVLDAAVDATLDPMEPPDPKSDETAIALPEIRSQLSVQEQNFLLVQRNRIRYDLDARSLALLSANGTVLVGPGALLELEFSLDTPWGAQTLQASDLSRGASQGQHLTWALKTTDPTHIEAVFWVPSPLGIGTAIIALLVLLGATLKAKLPSSASGHRR